MIMAILMIMASRTTTTAVRPTHTWRLCPGRTPMGRCPSLVFPELVEGSYELYEKLDGRIQLEVVIVGGHVTEATWPV